MRAYAVAGSFDDCHRLTREAFGDADAAPARAADVGQLGQHRPAAAADGLLLPRGGAGRAHGPRRRREIVVCTPSGNFGNLTAGLMAKRAGLPIARFVAATNVNDVVPEYLATGRFEPRPRCRRSPTRWTSATRATSSACCGCTTATSTRCAATSPAAGTPTTRCATTIKRVYDERGYLLDPHSAIAYLGLKAHLGGRRPGAGRGRHLSRDGASGEVRRDRRADPRPADRDAGAAGRGAGAAAAHPEDRRVVRRRAANADD